MAATIRDIAKMTKLSLATVSKYLNGGNVLQENKAAIEAAIKELHYEVNEVARGLATNRTKTIGVLIHNLENIFASSVISYIEDILRQHDYGTIICDCRGDKELEEQEIKFLLSKRVDGIITIPTADSPNYLSQAAKRKIPIVLIDRTFKDSDFDCVLVDNREAAYQAVNILIESGHKRIGIICGNENEYTAKERLEGYYKALETSEEKLRAKYIKRGALIVETGYEAMKELWALKTPPTAVFLTNYEITLGAVIAMNELGISFPKQISLIGFDNMMLSQVVNPKLWMVVQPMKEIAHHAADMILERLQGSDDGPQKKVILRTSILEGKSIRNCK